MYRSGNTIGGDANGVGEYYAGMGQAEEDESSEESFAPGEPAQNGPTMATVAAAAPVAVLDLKNPAAVIELKTAMAMAPYMLPLVFGQDAEPDFDEGFFKDPIWGMKATKFGRLWIEQFKKASPGIPNADAMLVSPHLFPASVGALMSLVSLGYRQPVANPIDFSNFPILTAYFDATGGDPSKGSVVAPFFSVEEQQGGVPTVQASTIAMIGLGLVGIVALGLVFSGKKR